MYKCEMFNVNFVILCVNMLGFDILVLLLNNIYYIVQLLCLVLGVKYINNKNVVFWNKGDVVILLINLGYYYCSLSI